MRINQPAAGALLALTLALAGCGGEREAAAAIPRERFVAANVAMRSVPDSAPNGAALRSEALRKHRVTEKDLKGFVAAHGRDPGYMAEVWREISNRVDSMWEKNRPKDVPPPQPTQPGPDGHQVIIGGEQPPKGRMPAPDPAASAGRMPSPPPLPRAAPPVRVREAPEAVRPGGDTTPTPVVRRPPTDPPPDTRPWVPMDSARLRLPPPKP